MQTRIVIIVALLNLTASLLGADLTPAAPKQTPAAIRQMWGGLDLFSCSLNLKSERDLLWYMFHRDGSVSATFGMKPGYTTSPLLSWKIEGEWLRVMDYDKKVLFQMRPLKLSETEITVDNGHGETQVFEIQPFEKSPKGTAPDAKENETKPH